MLRSHALNWNFMKGTGWMKGMCLIKGPTFLSLPAGSVGDQRVGDQLASETYVKEKQGVTLYTSITLCMRTVISPGRNLARPLSVPRV